MMNIRFMTLQEILDSGVIGWGDLAWDKTSPVSIDHDTFEAFVQARSEVVDLTRNFLEPFSFEAFGRSVEARPIGSEAGTTRQFGDKFLGFCQTNPQTYVLFIIEKQHGQWRATQDFLAVMDEDPVYVPTDVLVSIFTRLTTR